MTALLALLVLTQSPNTDAEIFVDRGETYIRAGLVNGLDVGSALEILDARTRQPAGSALVMEVWESLSRVSLDSKAGSHAPLKVARVLRRPEAVPAQPEPSAVAPSLEPTPSQPQPLGNGPGLDGHVTITGVDKARRVIIKNRGNRDWHNCDVRLPNGKHYWIGDLDEGDDEGVMLFRFDYDRNGPVQPAGAGIVVVCREGASRFPISL